jgi:hypothetical protein
MLLFATACGGGDNSENAFPKKLPVDERIEKNVGDGPTPDDVNDNAELTRMWTGERQKIDEVLEGNSGYYQTGDGVDADTKEYTTYYLDEEKTKPVKTRYTYNTGTFDMVYWLPNGQIWLNRDGVDYFVENDELVLTLRDGEPMEVSAEDQESALMVAARAKAQVKPTNYDF